ncbi:MAG: twin-arginine translocase TatA/TatE family subunit [Bacteroidia bacterium]|nr:twin-arginine translocase TatA/TatE family subunit [Bacteroidia bacterium]
MIQATILLGFLGGIGGTELMLLAGVVLLLFGGKKIPELMRGMGKGIKEFKNASTEVDSTDEVKQITKTNSI